MADLLNILLLEDSRTDARLIQSCLKTSRLSCKVIRVETLAELTGPFDVELDIALLDLNVPDSQGLDTIRNPGLPIVVLSGDANDETALQALRDGAQDFIPKNEFNQSALEQAIRFAIEFAAYPPWNGSRWHANRRAGRATLDLSRCRRKMTLTPF
ncbi:MAG: response regulator [Planctomycetota bacterium]|nr:response regulator [Planctomycetota bacterium]MDA1165594.1 response regulator [Planctomycetota bacterium]